MNGAAYAAVLVVAITALSLVSPAPWSEAEGADTWDGTADTSWYDGTATEYHIETAEQLAGLARIVNDGPNELVGVTVYLETDLDISGHEWDAIGQGNNISGHFGGTFDGQGHEIRGLTQQENNSIGLFYVVGSSGTIRNLGVTDVDIDYTGSRLTAGTVVSWVNGGTVENCYSTGSLYIGWNMLIGGLIGQCTAGAKVVGCYSTVDVTVNTPGYDTTVGGIVGQWENSTEASLIKDCHFSGSIDETGAGGSAVGGILGANFDFDDNQPGVDIEECFVTTTTLSSSTMENILWIGAVVHGNVSDCYWPSEPEDRAAVVKLVVDWNAGTASADPDFDQSSCGEAVSDFSSPEFLQMLDDGRGVWIAGPDGTPIHSWDSGNHSADYGAVEEAIAVTAGMDASDYSNWSDVQSAMDEVVWGLTFDRQPEVDAMAAAILDAIEGLEPALPPFIPFPPEQGGDPIEVWPSEDGSTTTSDDGDDTLKAVACAAAAVIAAILIIILASTYRHD